MEGTFSDDTFRFVSPDAYIVLFGDLCVAMRLSAVHQKHNHQEYKYCQQFGHRLMTVSLLCISETRKAQQIHDLQGPDAVSDLDGFTYFERRCCRWCHAQKDNVTMRVSDKLFY